MTNHFETLYCTYIYLGHPINCKVGSWENWSPCSKTCGIGESKRTRTIVRKAKRGGKDCPPLVGMRWCGSARNCHGAYFDWWIWITKNITVKPTLTFKYCTSNPRKQIQPGFWVWNWKVARGESYCCVFFILSLNDRWWLTCTIFGFSRRSCTWIDQ